MLLALRSLWEQAKAVAVSGGPGGPYRGSPGVNYGQFYDPKHVLDAVRRRRFPSAVAIALYTSGQIDLNAFAALLAATTE